MTVKLNFHHYHHYCFVFLNNINVQICLWFTDYFNSSSIDHFKHFSQLFPLTLFVKLWRFWYSQLQKHFLKANSPSVVITGSVNCIATCCINYRHVYHFMTYGMVLPQNTLRNRVPVAQWLAHCVSSAKVVGSIPREHTYWQYKCIAWMHCKSLWIKASAKCINVNVNTEEKITFW